MKKINTALLTMGLIFATSLSYTPSAEAGILSGIKDAALQAVTYIIVAGEVGTAKNKALKCYEKEGVSERQVTAFFKNTPKMPFYKDLLTFRKTSQSYADAAAKFSSNDKVGHCHAGYNIQKKIGYKIAVFAAFFKEAKDVSDCNANTHFEIADQQATIWGAQLAQSTNPKYSVEECYKAPDRVQGDVKEFEL